MAARLNLKADIIRALFARSGNQCAFPGCAQVLINYKNQFVGQVCHIEAALPGGERYNAGQSDEERRGYDNLILLCYPHHVETNDVMMFSVDALREMKYRHEREFGKNAFKIDESALFAIVAEMEDYWRRVEVLNSSCHSEPQYSVEIDPRMTYFDIAKSCHCNLD